jgi:hypothetical protein
LSWLHRWRKRKRRLWKRPRTSGMPQLSTNGTLCKRMFTSTYDVYVLSGIRPWHRIMSYTIREDLGKDKSKQSKFSVDFDGSKG